MTEADVIEAAKRGYIRAEYTASHAQKKLVVWEDRAFDEFLIRGLSPDNRMQWQHFYEWIDDSLYGEWLQYRVRPGKAEYRDPYSKKVIATSADLATVRKRMLNMLAELKNKTRRRKAISLADKMDVGVHMVFLTAEEIRHVIENLPKRGLGVPIIEQFKRTEAAYARR